MAMKATINTLTRDNLIAWGYEYDESAPYAVVRYFKTTGPKPVGSLKNGAAVIPLPNGDRPRAGVVSWILHNGDIPDGYTVALQDPADGRIGNTELITTEEATERRRAARAAAASGPRKQSNLPRGIVETSPGYYVASFMCDGKRTHKAGRDLDSLTFWLFKERDGLDLTMGGKL
ncbi:hypothetical protein BB778_02105 [Pluralibacter gergoviae]|uniref:hypothetical protein n=1 Tax=Pluralibacter gergoviae TaxID=61647 RepID=UPI0008DBE8ED|nr:hypothetical protein [Pluralibacter gergoviae]OHY66534.1 hypothetical protein BB778_02105 [Pluralibacter gergoviae]